MENLVNHLKNSLSQPFDDRNNFIIRAGEDLRIPVIDAEGIDLSRKAPRLGAVLILIYPWQNDLYIPLIQRPVYDGVHSGQIAFPGGKKDDTDPLLVYTALRETMEEVGIEVPTTNVIGVLSNVYIPPSNFMVTPVVAYSDQRPASYRLHEREVERVLEVKLSDLMNPENSTMQDIRISTGAVFKLPCYMIEGQQIWGATARMISELVEVLGNGELVLKNQ